MIDTRNELGNPADHRQEQPGPEQDLSHTVQPLRQVIVSDFCLALVFTLAGIIEPIFGIILILLAIGFYLRSLAANPA
jgi:hypothetical protein